LSSGAWRYRPNGEEQHGEESNEFRESCLHINKV
jgi:hypothetical protein